jgi:hypothetical protein
MCSLAAAEQYVSYMRCSAGRATNWCTHPAHRLCQLWITLPFMCQVKLEGAVSGSEARIGQPNIMICKSVMHIVDAVLLPAPIADLAAGKVGYHTPEVPAVW